MEVVYYYDEKLEIYPVEQYFIDGIINCKKLNEKRKKKLLYDIRTKISKVLKNKGIPDGYISKSLKKYHLIEIRNRKDQNILIRICYVRSQNKIVLLHAFEKPDDCGKKYFKKQIGKQFKIAEDYHEKFKLNPNNYKLYEKG